MQLLGDPLGLQGALAEVKWLQYLQGGSHQVLAGEDAAVADEAFVGVYRHQSMDYVVGPQLVGPTALGVAPRNPAVFILRILTACAPFDPLFPAAAPGARPKARGPASPRPGCTASRTRPNR